MSEIKYRLAKVSDAKEIANVHWSVRDRYSQGIFLSLGKNFLYTYYKIILNDPWEVVVCAVNKSGKIIGFASTTMDAKEQSIRLRNHKLQLGFSALLEIIKHPSLALAVWQRYKSLKDNGEGPVFVHTEGVRGEYWCWLKNEDSLKSIELSNIKNKVLYNLGVSEMFFEVDKFNKAVYNYHLKINKAEPISEVTLPDGRVRVLMKKTLKY